MILFSPPKKNGHTLNKINFFFKTNIFPTNLCFTQVEIIMFFNQHNQTIIKLHVLIITNLFHLHTKSCNKNGKCNQI